jgi:Phosphatidylinositol 3- and 4-kinase
MQQGSDYINFIRRCEAIEVAELLKIAQEEWVSEQSPALAQLLSDFAEVYEGQTFERTRGELLWGKVGERTALLVKPEPTWGGPGLPSSKREQIAFLLFSTRVPLTLWVQFPTFLASVQQFAPNTTHPTIDQRATLESEELQWIAHIDVVLGNRDRHFRNILLAPNGKLIPIDHTYALLPKWRPCRFCWLSLSQISEPILSSVRLDLDRAGEILDQLRSQEVVEAAILECERRMTLEKSAIEAGLTYYEIGSIFATGAYGHLCSSSAPFQQETEGLCRELLIWKQRADQLENIEEGKRLLDTTEGFVEQMIELWLARRGLYPRGWLGLYVKSKRNVLTVERVPLSGELVLAFGRKCTSSLTETYPGPEVIQRLGEQFLASPEAISQQQLCRLRDFIQNRPAWAAYLSSELRDFVEDFIRLYELVPTRDTLEHYTGSINGEKRLVFKPHLTREEQKARLPLRRDGTARPLRCVEQVRYEQIAHLLFPEKAPIALWILLSNPHRHYLVQRYLHGRLLSELSSAEIEAIVPVEVQWIAHIDLMLGIYDRHEKNVILTPDGRLMAIDHGAALRSKLTVGLNFWTRHPAIRHSVEPALLERILSTDLAHLLDLLRRFGISEKSVRCVRLRALLEREALLAGLNLFDVAVLMWKYRFQEETRSEIVDLVREHEEEDFSEAARMRVLEIAQWKKCYQPMKAGDDPFLAHLAAVWRRWPEVSADFLDRRQHSQ